MKIKDNRHCSLLWKWGTAFERGMDCHAKGAKQLKAQFFKDFYWRVDIK